MSPRHFCAAALFALTACAAPSTQTTMTTTPTAGFVTDLTSFDAFIATTPTPEQFKARYPDVTLALPGSINTKEMRMNNSRYFAQLDAQGRITGGKFQ
ncbi:MAG: hypothetical protein V4709_15070 [Pseudomonadota bacterium]